MFTFRDARPARKLCCTESCWQSGVLLKNVWWKNPATITRADAAHASGAGAATVLIRRLRPALGCVFPSRGAHGLRRWNGWRCRHCDASRRLRSVDGGRQGWLRHVCGHFFFLGEQRSHQSQGLHFLLQSRQFHLFLPQYFVNILHDHGPCRLCRSLQTFLRTLADLPVLSRLSAPLALLRLDLSTNSLDRKSPVLWGFWVPHPCRAFCDRVCPFTLTPTEPKRPQPDRPSSSLARP